MMMMMMMRMMMETQEAQNNLRGLRHATNIHDNPDEGFKLGVHWTWDGTVPERDRDRSRAP